MYRLLNKAPTFCSQPLGSLFLKFFLILAVSTDEQNNNFHSHYINSYALLLNHPMNFKSCSFNGAKESMKTCKNITSYIS